MHQTSQSSIPNVDPSKTKKHQTTRNLVMANRDPSKQIKRLKSNHDIHGSEPEHQTTNLPTKPRSSVGRRPSSSRRPAETPASQTTAETAFGENEVKEIVGNIFSHSKKLREFLVTNSLD